MAMGEPEALDGLSAQENHLSTGIFFDFGNSSDSRRAWIPTSSAGSWHLTGEVSHFLGPQFQSDSGQTSCCALFACT